MKSCVYFKSSHELNILFSHAESLIWLKGRKMYATEKITPEIKEIGCADFSVIRFDSCNSKRFELHLRL
jgi:hypothetical protein